MATLTRPGVEISQEIITESPTVLTPSLVPCVVGPCFQIVEPITSAGLLNSGAQVTTSAIIVSSTVSDPASLSGLAMLVSINGGDNQTVQFPVTINNVGLSHALIVNTINKALTGAVAEIKNNKLILRTESKGASSSIKLLTVGSNAYTVLGLTSFVDKLIKGTSSYSNLTQSVPYSSLPSPLANISEIVLQGSGIDVFRYFNNTLTQFSETSAINWNSYVTSVNQPATNLGRTKLFGKPKVGSKTNTLVDLGKSASIIIPLSGDGNASGNWPDTTGSKYLKVSAIGLEPYIDNPANQPGDYIGTAGNNVVVDIGTASPASAAFSADTLTIRVVAGTTTFAQLKNLIDSVTGISNKIKVELWYDQADKDDKVLNATDYPIGETFNLTGGVDPVNFAPINITTTSANVTGATHVTATSTGDSLDVTGKTLEVSVDGSDFIPVTFTSNGNPHTLITNALGSLGTCSIASTQTNDLDENYDALRITSASTDKHDSTIELRASDNTVIENLFSGYKTRTETPTYTLTTNEGGSKLDDLVSGTDFNKNAHVSTDKAISEGSVTANLSNCLGIGIVIFEGTTGFSGLDTKAISITHGSTTNILTIGPPASNTAAGLAAAIDAVNTGALSTLVGFTVISLGGTSYVAAYDKTATAGASLRVNTIATDPEFVAFVGAASLDTLATTSTTSVVIKDSGADGALQISSVSNGLSNVVTTVTGLTLSSYLDSGAGLNHSTGTLSIKFPSDTIEVTKKSIVFKMPNTPGLSLTYSRFHASATGPNPPLYTTRVFHGDSNVTELGDLLYNNGTVLGRVVALQDFVAGASAYTNAQMVISEYAVDAKAQVSDWYVKAEGLVSGDDRVEAEATYNDLEGTINLKHALIRDGAGVAKANSSAPVYVQYKALRKDVTSSATSPGLLVFNSIAEVESLIGPVTQDNPLAFGLSLAFLNAPTISLSALGVDETSADAPDGTLDGYQRALDYLELKEVYAIAPLTQDREVHKLLSLHVTELSKPESKKERMGIVSMAIPTEKEPTLVISGTATIGPEINGKYVLTFADDTLNIPTALNGKTDANNTTIVGGVGQDYTTQAGIYLDREGDAFKYWVSKVVGTNQVQIEINDAFLPGGGPGTGGNDDGFYKTDNAALADFPANGELVTILVRQAAIDTSTTAGKLAACEALAEIAGGASGYQNRRLVALQPEQVGTTLDGTELLVPGHYVGAAIASMIGQQNPSQPFTNLPMVGFTRPVGSNDKFSETQMSTAAAGGIYWVIQDTPGGPLASRHQLTTDVTSLKTRELSILKSIDYLSKLIRNQVKRFIGRNNITKQLLETVALGINGALSNASGSVVASASLDRIAQDKSNLDTITVEISVVPFYPANYIKITIFV